jgi:hypothetical protein
MAMTLKGTLLLGVLRGIDESAIRGAAEGQE